MTANASWHAVVEPDLGSTGQCCGWYYIGEAKNRGQAYPGKLILKMGTSPSMPVVCSGLLLLSSWETVSVTFAAVEENSVHMWNIAQKHQYQTQIRLHNIFIACVCHPCLFPCTSFAGLNAEFDTLHCRCDWIMPPWAYGVEASCP